MKPVKPILTIGLTATMVLLSGCVKLWQENVDIKTYMLEVNRVSDAQTEALGDKLWIDTVSMLPPFNIRSIVLRESDVEFSTSYYSQLLMSPSENFRNEFFAWFSESGLFSDVSIVGRSGMSHSLTVTIMDFYGDLQSNEANLGIKVTLFDEKTKGVRVLFSSDYYEKVKVDEVAAENLMRAYNQALAKILMNCEKDIAAALK